MKSPHQFISTGLTVFNRQRILLVVLLTASVVSIALTSRDGARAYHAAAVSSVATSGFVITSPVEGSLVPCGQPVNVTWTGGEPADSVNVVLIDIQANQVFQGFGYEPNTGSRVVTIGPGSCGRTSRFYVEDSPRTNYTYGPVFTVGDAPPTPTPTPTPTPSPVTCGTTYNAVSDFSKTANPTGPWSYGWESSLGGAFILNAGERSPYQGLDTWEGPDGGGDFNLPLVSFNHTGATLDYASGVSQPAGMLNLHPSFTGKLSVLRWTAPANGSFSVVGLFQGIDTRNTTSDVHVLQNSSTSLFSGNINGFGNQSAFNFTRNLAAGDTLDFVVGWGSNGNYSADSTGLSVTITASPVFNIADGDVAGLIAAINSANANTCPTTINLAHNGTYTLSTVADYGLGESGAPGPAGLPYIRSQLTINGNGATIQRSNAAGTPAFVMIAVSSSDSGYHHAYNAKFTLSGVTLRGASLGGLGITHGVASVSNSTITQNAGGGINNFCGKLTLLNSTVSYNTSGNLGGGIALESPCGDDTATAYISFSTIYENQNATGTNAQGEPYGPGYAIADYFGHEGDVVVKNSILASPTRSFFPARACDGASPISQGHNIVGDSSCGFTGPGDMQDTNPLLGPLANNGGLTPTHQPLCHSPAIDAVPFADSTDVYGAAITTDQRGITRPIGAALDIGSVEAGSTVSTTATIPGNAGPWNQSMNPTFDYGVHDNAPPVVINASSGIPFIAGSNLRVTYVSGTVTGDGGGGYFDANGSSYPTNTYDSGNGRFPGFYMNPGPIVYGGELVGAFAHYGVIVGSPFPIGNGPKSLTIPVGATELMMGINDNRYGDNSGALIMRVTAGQTETLPTVSCPAPLAASADVNCQAHVPDVLSGVTASGSCGGPVTLSQSPATGTLVGLGTTTITVTATDASNNSSSCTTTFTVTDATPPTISITAPSSAAAYLLNQSVIASYGCTDCGSVASCIGPVASGGNLDTATVGIKSFTVTATDNAGNSATPQSVNYTVSFGVRVLFDQTRAAKSGSTIPVKIQLVDANGNNVSSPAVVVHAVSVVQTSSSASVLLDDAGQANPDFDFRFDPTLGGTGGYIFNLKTTGYGTGTYRLNYTVGGDPLIHTVQFQVRQ